MNETGKVFVGTHHRPKGRRWVYGQFSDVALPAAQLLLEQSGLNPTERGNPVQVVRAIASIVMKLYLIIGSRKISQSFVFEHTDQRQRRLWIVGRQMGRLVRRWSLPVGLDWKLQNLRALLAQRI